MRGRLIGGLVTFAVMAFAVMPSSAGSVPGFGPLSLKLFRLTFKAEIKTNWDLPQHPQDNEPCVYTVSGAGHQTVEFPKMTNPYQVTPYQKGDPFFMQPYHGDGSALHTVQVHREGDIFHDQNGSIPPCEASFHDDNDGCGTWHQDWALTDVEFTPGEVRPMPNADPRPGFHPCPFFGGMSNGAEAGPAFANNAPFVEEKFPHAEHVLAHHDVTIIQGKQKLHRKAAYDSSDTKADAHAVVEWTLRIKRLKG